MKIIVDTREKTPWEFEKSTSRKLDTGDYSVEGYEDKICIERKKSVNEISRNIVNDAFWREMERMKEIPHRVIICEFSQQDVIQYPRNVSFAFRSKIKIGGKFIMSRLRKIQDEYGIEIQFCHNSNIAKTYATDWLTEKYERLSNTKK